VDFKFKCQMPIAPVTSAISLMCNVEQTCGLLWQIDGRPYVIEGTQWNMHKTSKPLLYVHMYLVKT